MSTPRLNLPRYDFRMRETGGKQMIYDDLRQTYVRLTPEEWVRQHFVRYLVEERQYPQGLIAIEHAFTYQGMMRRADIVVFSREGAAAFMVECKAPSVAVSQKTFDQVARYNKIVAATYLGVTNGQEHYCCRLDQQARTYAFLQEIPAYDELQLA